MGRLWNRYIRWVMKKISSTGLEQELNQSEVTENWYSRKLPLWHGRWRQKESYF